MHPFDALEVNHGRVGSHWVGQRSFVFKDSEGMVTQVDPYFPLDRPPDQFIHPESPLDETTLRTDFVLLTHDHGDHEHQALVS